MTVPWLLSDAHGHMGTKAERNERREAGIPSISCAITPKEAKELIRESREENLGGEDGRQQERYLFPAAGIHPWYADRYELQDMETWMERCPLIGEIGMDSVWCSVDLKTQEIRFRQQLELALRQNKPVILHTKGQEKEIGDVIRQYPNRYLVHWYSCDSYLEKYLEMDCCFSIGPDVWWNPSVQNTARQVPADRLLIETDGLDAVKWAYEEGIKAFKKNIIKKPETWEGTEHVTFALAHTLEAVAEIRHMPPERLGEEIRDNLLRFCGKSI